MDCRRGVVRRVGRGLEGVELVAGHDQYQAVEWTVNVDLLYMLRAELWEG